jgi:hypothetical protein
MKGFSTITEIHPQGSPGFSRVASAVAKQIGAEQALRRKHKIQVSGRNLKTASVREMIPEIQFLGQSAAGPMGGKYAKSNR